MGESAPGIPQAVEEPIFKGYVFARVPTVRFHEAKSCPGVVRVLMQGDRPHILPESLLGDLILLTMSGKLDEVQPIGRRAKPIIRRSRSKGARRRKLSGMHQWFEAAGVVARRA